MVNGFVREGVLHDKKIESVIPRQIELIEEYNKENELKLIPKAQDYIKYMINVIIKLPRYVVAYY